MIILRKQSGEGKLELRPGEFIREVFVQELGGNQIKGGIRFGTKHGAGDLIGGLVVEADSFSRLCYDGTAGISLDAPVVVYFDAVLDWNGAVVDIFIDTGLLE